jgi:hypothetical protein
VAEVDLLRPDPAGRVAAVPALSCDPDGSVRGGPALDELHELVGGRC